MDQGVYVAVSGAKIQELRLEVAANNLANANTSGYKADRVTSRSFLFELERAGQSQRPPARTVPRNMGDGVYSKTLDVGIDHQQGQHTFTGNPYSVALDGPGYVAVDTPGGVRYTRAGQFARDSEGALVTPEGHQVRGRGLDRLGEDTFSIDSRGNVLVDGNRTGSIEIVEFSDQRVLRKEGHNLFVDTSRGSACRDAEETVVKQGYTEASNIDVVREMVNLIEINRTYETYQKMITSIDESTGKLINEVGGAL